MHGLTNKVYTTTLATKIGLANRAVCSGFHLRTVAVAGTQVVNQCTEEWLLMWNCCSQSFCSG